MAKNGSAARARDGGKAQETTVQSRSGAAPRSELSGATQAVGNPALNSGSGTDNLQGNASGGTETGNSSAADNSSLQETSLATGGTLSIGTQLIGEDGHELRLDLSTLLNRDASSDKSNTGAAAVIGESFDKMLADSFRSMHGLKVTSSQAGFRRAGRAWNTTPTVIALSELTDDQVTLLKDEPMLSVELVDLEGEDA
ncbi:hypothetical protein ACEN9H_23390 [Massilia cellulosiltytica]|uniref:hypothetical protein n=1 Tax=Massilia cellulosiltytica TaxID=2683234 RepID=UPI0039B690F7